MSTPAAPGPPTPIAVTGATGRIGGAVAALLHERGAPLPIAEIHERLYREVQTYLGGEPCA